MEPGHWKRVFIAEIHLHEDKLRYRYKVSYVSEANLSKIKRKLVYVLFRTSLCQRYIMRYADVVVNPHACLFGVGVGVVGGHFTRCYNLNFAHSWDYPHQMLYQVIFLTQFHKASTHDCCVSDLKDDYSQAWLYVVIYCPFSRKYNISSISLQWLALLQLYPLGLFDEIHDICFPVCLIPWAWNDDSICIIWNY